MISGNRGLQSSQIVVDIKKQRNLKKDKTKCKVGCLEKEIEDLKKEKEQF